MDDNKLSDRVKAVTPRKHRLPVFAAMYIMALAGSVLIHPITCLILFCTLLFTVAGWDPVTNKEDTYKQVVVFNLAVWASLQTVFSIAVTVLQYYKNKFPKLNEALRK